MKVTIVNWYVQCVAVWYFDVRPIYEPALDEVVNGVEVWFPKMAPSRVAARRLLA